MPPLHRRNFLPTVILNLVLWLSCGLIVFFLNPNTHFNLVLFFIALTLTFTLTFALLLGNTRRGFFLSIFLIGGLILRLGKILNWFTFVPLFIFLLMVELFFIRKKRR